MARERTIKRREGNEIEFGRIVAFSDGVFLLAVPLAFLAPRAAPYPWLLLFIDPPSHFGARLSRGDT